MFLCSKNISLILYLSLYLSIYYYCSLFITGRITKKTSSILSIGLSARPLTERDQILSSSARDERVLQANRCSVKIRWNYYLLTVTEVCQLLFHST